MTTTGTPALAFAPESAWTKSSYSGAEGNACVETAALVSTVGVRDSKDKRGPALVFLCDSWSTFVTSLRDEEFQTATRA
ncbi:MULTISPECIES: DUF397 domain-containing protein [unclassified Streptomyces]|uniref:DUF397 domain-containing protein n=1 Tax=unclassified Streptomyces TaxID=2593676 RepID=UPI0037BA7A03